MCVWVYVYIVEQVDTFGILKEYCGHSHKITIRLREDTYSQLQNIQKAR